MNLKKVLSALSMCCIVLSSCSNEDVVEQVNELEIKESPTKTLEFKSRDDLNEALSTNFANDNITRSNESVDDYYQTVLAGESLYDQPSYEEYMIDYVPNPRFAKLLNKNGEFVVNDTIYKITPNGTYFYERNKKDEFDGIFERDTAICGSLIGDKLYKIADGIYRKDTYYYKRDEAKEEVLEDTDQIKTKASSLYVSYGANPNYNAFETFGMTHENLLQFIIKNIIGNYTAHTVNFSNDKRRVRGEFYENDHFVYGEIGAKGWTDKKNWIGWSKTEADELRVGWRDVLIATKIPNEFAKSTQQMNQLVETADQYFYFPGTSKRVNARTFAIPDLDQSTLKGYLDKGSKYLFDWLKSRYGLSTTQSDWDRLQAAIIVSRTHIFQIIKNEDVVMYNCESYTHVFTNHARIGIELNQSSFSGSVPSILKNVIISIVKGTTQIEFPTIIGGKVQIAARFGNEWRGMNIEKKSSLDKIFKN